MKFVYLLSIILFFISESPSKYRNREYASPNTASINQSQMALSNVSLRSDSQEDYVPIENILSGSRNCELPDPFPIGEMTQRSPVDYTQSHRREVDGSQRGRSETRSPQERRSSSRPHFSNRRSQAARPSTLTINDQQYVTLEDFQRALQGSQGSQSSQSADRVPPPTPRLSRRNVSAARNLVPEFRDNIPSSDDDDGDEERTITVAKCLEKPTNEVINSTCVCYVIELEPSQPLHPLVYKPRRKICVGDHTGVMVGYIRRSQAVLFERGNTLRLYGFTMRTGTFLIHDNTSASS